MRIIHTSRGGEENGEADTATHRNMLQASSNVPRKIASITHPYPYPSSQSLPRQHNKSSHK